MSESILNHPVIRKPDPNAILAACGGDATLAHAEFARLTKIRNTMILSEQADPLRNGWEPPIWRFCDALLGLPWVPVEEAKRVQSMVSGRRITVLLIMGANRSSKTTYAAKRAMRLLHLLDGEGAWCYHENNPNSIRQHHKLMWHFMPPESKKKTLSEVEGIS
ncbi:MAG: hypothetical protein OEN50_03125, partial [Deltaproteobacteria bacterium]|nr:hypothetical protein [Deltaproteobacteria bacterium]